VEAAEVELLAAGDGGEDFADALLVGVGEAREDGEGFLDAFEEQALGGETLPLGESAKFTGKARVPAMRSRNIASACKRSASGTRSVSAMVSVARARR
jgi:hypothetical protein